MFNSFGAVFVVLAFAWVLQLILSLLQTKRFHKRIAELKRDGHMTSVGMAGSNWKRKVYSVLVVDEERNIVRAEKMSGFTVFADLKPVEGLNGMSLSRLKDPPPEGIKPKLWEAFRSAAGFIERKDAEEREQAVSSTPQ